MAARRESGGGRSAAGRSGGRTGGRAAPAAAGRGASRVQAPPAGGRGGRAATGGQGSAGRATARASKTAGSGRQYASRGAARTGKVTAPGEAPKADRPLGGEQVEGRQAVRELLLAGTRKVREVWVATDLDGNEVVGDIVDIARSVRVPVQEVNRKRLEATARSEAPQGVVAFAAPLRETPLDDLLRRRGATQPFLVAVDGVTDPGNLGALLRCCDGAGVQGVVIPRHRAVHVTPTVAKAAAGAVEHVPMALVGGLPAALARMKEAGIWVVGLDDGAERELFELGDLARDGICLVLGAEGSGLSRLVRERCDLIVSIPMRGRLSSLNVSAAAALATYEVARHRLR
ncbi:MAG: 23S rRNA (guanosine(2251)-2'-O)-methyltransferase RlmB [Ilumatobacteraceae bacterium]